MQRTPIDGQMRFFGKDLNPLPEKGTTFFSLHALVVRRFGGNRHGTPAEACVSFYIAHLSIKTCYTAVALSSISGAIVNRTTYCCKYGEKHRFLCAP